MPKVIIHGASSFVGKHFCRYLIANNFELVIVARSSSSLTIPDDAKQTRIVRYAQSLDEITLTGFDDAVMIDFSWAGVFGSERNSVEQITVNVPLILASVDFARRNKVKHWIGFGSQAEYGNLNKRISESDKCEPTTLYGKSKVICSRIAEELCEAYNIEYTWLRLFSVYGPDDNHEWFIQYLIKQMKANAPLDVTKGEQSWDYLYVTDIVDMLAKLISHNGLGIVNLGSGKSIQLKSIIEIIKQETNSDSIINYGAVPYRPDQVMFMEADNAKLCAALNWKPETSIQLGLRRTISNN